MINLIGSFILAIGLIAIWRHGPGMSSFEASYRRLPLFAHIALCSIFALLLGGRLIWGNDFHIPTLGMLLFFLEGLNFWIHEAGHGFLFFIGGFWMSAGGTILELGLPLSVAVYAWKTKCYFALSLTLFWLSIAFGSVGRYARDARSQKLELVGGGSHDWNVMLSSLGLLELDGVIGAAALGLAMIALIAGAVIYAYATKHPVSSSFPAPTPK